MTPEALVQVANRNLGADSVVALRPDLPHLFAGPDVLIGRAGKLLAIFLLKASERRSPDDLLIRLAMSRLALPSHTQCLLIVEPGEISDVETGLLATHFHDVDYPADISDLLDSKLNANQPDYVSVVLKDLQTQAFLRSNILIAETQKWFGEDETDQQIGPFQGNLQGYRFRRAEIPSWRMEGSPRSYRSNRIYRDEQVIIGYASQVERPALRHLGPVVKAGFKIQYKMDSGFPYRFDNTVNVLIVNGMPQHMRDPLKPIKVAAFAGWAMLPSNKLGRFDTIVNNLVRAYERTEATD